MRTLLIDNIGELVTNDPALGRAAGRHHRRGGCHSGGVVTWVGHTSDAPEPTTTGVPPVRR